MMISTIMRQVQDKRKGNLKKVIKTCIAVAFWIAVWYIGASAANKGLLLKIPLPHETVAALFSNFGNPSFWASVGVSVGHILAGFACAFLLGTAGGMISGLSGLFKSFSEPLMHAIRAVPVAAFVIIAWLWIPNSILPACIAFLMVLPIVWGHVDAGLAGIDRVYIETALTEGASRVQAAGRIQLPLLLPTLKTGSLVSFGIAWKAGVAAEVICNPTGSIGALLQQAKTSIDFPQVFAVTLAIVLISYLLELVLKAVWMIPGKLMDAF